MIIQHSQVGQDGLGQELKVEAQSVTLKAKTVSVIRNTTLRVTGLTTGATWSIGLIVKPGNQVLYSPPPVNLNPPSGPVAGFSWGTGTIQV
tara:strand:- start:289 stop:561 length:273 start_codon:yes stop_codon:yes gene_type:complete